MSEEQALAAARARITEYRATESSTSTTIPLDLFFREGPQSQLRGRTRDVSDDQLREIYDLAQIRLHQLEHAARPPHLSSARPKPKSACGPA